MRILVIEDEKKIAHAIQKGLTQESYAVDVAYDGEQGVDLAMSESYDVVIVDIMLPKLDGVELTKRLRAHGTTVPVLMLTARDSVSDKVAGLDSGADDYLTKPFAFDELVARVRALLRRPLHTTTTVLTVGSLSLDPTSFEVRRANHIVALTTKEFALLEYLMRHPNAILSKEQIISHVWNFDADILPNTVEVYIGYLRGKIDKPFPTEPPLIHTVRGFGYKISA